MRFLIGLALVAAGVVNAQVGQIGRGVNLYSLEKEVSLGAQLAADMRQKTMPVDSAAVRDYVDAIGARLAAQLPPHPPISFTFAVVTGGELPLLEPLSIPGGYLFVPASLILTAQNEAEFVGTLAHAMAHVAARHSTRIASRAEIAQLAVDPLPPFPRAGAQTSLPREPLQFDRGFEREADVIAANIAAGAGFDPSGLASYISRVQDDATAFPSMPRRDDRVQAIQQAIATLPQRSYASSADFPRIQEEVRKLTTAPK